MALTVTMLVRIETKWLGTKKTFEWFSTAGRRVKTGLFASSVVSTWTWAATLLQSSTVAYQIGISGPFWYAASASIQVMIFTILAMELKRKAPSSHTFPEMIYARFGKHSHKISCSLPSWQTLRLLPCWFWKGQQLSCYWIWWNHVQGWPRSWSDKAEIN